VRPHGINKGVMVDHIVSELYATSGGIDFILCVGDDSGDEYMFQALAERFSSFSSNSQQARPPPPPPRRLAAGLPALTHSPFAYHSPPGGATPPGARPPPPRRPLGCSLRPSPCPTCLRPTCLHAPRTDGPPVRRAGRRARRVHGGGGAEAVGGAVLRQRPRGGRRALPVAAAALDARQPQPLAQRPAEPRQQGDLVGRRPRRRQRLAQRASLVRRRGRRRHPARVLAPARAERRGGGARVPGARAQLSQLRPALPGARARPLTALSPQPCGCAPPRPSPLR
jgi:hypothetical protein